MQDHIISEIRLTLLINGEKSIPLSCSGRHVNELITGYLYTNGYINETGDIRRLDYEMSNQKATLRIEKSPLKATDFDGATAHPKKHIQPETVFQWMTSFAGVSERFRKTGAVHTAAIANEKGIQKYFDDISRHNTLDMMIGWGLLENYPQADKWLLLSCRISTSIMEKALKGGFQAIISTSPPTDQALKLARHHNITLAGFVRDQRMNIYHGEEWFSE